MADFGEVGSASVAIRADFDTFRKDMRSAESTTRTASQRMSRALGTVGKAAKGVAIAGGVMTVGFLALTKRALSAAESIGDMAARANTTAESLQELRFAANQNGASFQTVDDALTRLTRRMSIFVQEGGGPGAKAFEELGIAVRDADGNLRDSSDVFDEIGRKLAGMEDDAKAAAVASAAFGEDAGPRLVPLLKQGEDGIRAAREEARRLGVVLSNDVVNGAAEASAKLRAVEQAVGTQLTSAFARAAPKVTELVDAFTRNLPAIIEFIQKVSTAIGLIETPVSVQLAGKVAELREVQNELSQLSQGQMRGPGSIGAGPGGREELERRQDRLLAEVRALEEQRQVLRGRVDLAREGLDEGVSGGAGSGVGGAADLGPTFKDAKSQIIDMTVELRNQQAALGMTEKEAAAYRAELEAFGIEVGENVELTAKQTQRLADLRENHIQAAIALEEEREAQEAATEAQREAAEAQREADRAAADQKRQIEGLITGFSNAAQSVDSFEDALRRIGIPLAKVVAQAALLGEGPLGGFLGGSLKSALASGTSSLFAPTPATPAQVAAFPLPKFAGGTDFAPGGPALVGELGPEIVDLPRGSRVTPNDQLGGVTVHVDARGSTDPAATEAAAMRGAQAALTQVPGIVKNMRRWGQV